MTEPRHCEDYIRDKTQPMCLRKFLLFKRIPVTWQWKWTEKGWPAPKLFATYKEPNGPGGRKGKTRRVRVTMASRFGDVGINRDFEAEGGYFARVAVEQLTEFSETPFPAGDKPVKETYLRRMEREENEREEQN